MARRTIRQLFGRENLVCGCQLLPKILRGCRWLPMHGKYLLARPDVTGRISVAFQTPFHRERFLAPHQRHGIHLSMTGHTAHSLREMDAVIEIYKVREPVDACPFDGSVVSKAGTDRFQFRTIGPDLRVAIHAGLRGRNSGKRASLYRGVAVPAIDSDVANVMFMAERHRLEPHYPCFGKIRGPHNLNDRQSHSTDNEHGAEYGEPGQEIHSPAERLAHGMPHRFTPRPGAGTAAPSTAAPCDTSKGRPPAENGSGSSFATNP